MATYTDGKLVIKDRRHGVQHIVVLSNIKLDKDAEPVLESS